LALLPSSFTLILYPLDIYVNKKTPFYLFFEKKIWIYFRLGERPPGGAGSSGGCGNGAGGVRLLPRRRRAAGWYPAGWQAGPG
jgi:hypothetical protein